MKLVKIDMNIIYQVCYISSSDWFRVSKCPEMPLTCRDCALADVCPTCVKLSQMTLKNESS